MSSETIFQRPHPNSMLTRDPAHPQGAGCINVSKILTQYRQALQSVTADPAFLYFLIYYPKWKLAFPISENQENGPFQDFQTLRPRESC